MIKSLLALILLSTSLYCVNSNLIFPFVCWILILILFSWFVNRFIWESNWLLILLVLVNCVCKLSIFWLNLFSCICRFYKLDLSAEILICRLDICLLISISLCWLEFYMDFRIELALSRDCLSNFYWVKSWFSLDWVVTILLLILDKDAINWVRLLNSLFCSYIAEFSYFKRITSSAFS